jgi:hypothetical protein
MRSVNPYGALPLFIGGEDHAVVRGCEYKSEEVIISYLSFYLSEEHSVHLHSLAPSR